MERVGVQLVTIGIRSTGEFARGLRYLVLCFELSTAWLEERVPEMALLNDSALVAKVSIYFRRDCWFCSSVMGTKRALAQTNIQSHFVKIAANYHFAF
jgi:hypothetical protein